MLENLSFYHATYAEKNIAQYIATMEKLVAKLTMEQASSPMKIKANKDETNFSIVAKFLRCTIS